MPTRRKVLAALGSLSAGSAAVLGSGATRFGVQADRPMAVQIADDSSAYLSFRDVDGVYAKKTLQGIRFDFKGGNDQRGEGLNKQADTKFSDLFQIVNQSENDLELWVRTDEPCQDPYESIEILVGGDDADLDDVSQPGTFVSLPSGESKEVDFVFHVDAGLATLWDDQVQRLYLQFVARTTEPPTETVGCVEGRTAGRWGRGPRAGRDDSTRF